jgi:hypothetical protein
MPAWKGALNENEIWQVIAFLGHIDKLSPDVMMKWKNASFSPGLTRSVTSLLQVRNQTA